jgi:hypothetical protein
MADLQHGATLRCRCNHLIGFREASGDRLFHEHMNAGLEQTHCDFTMRLGWDCQTHRFDTSYQFTPVARAFDISLRSDFTRRLFIQITNGNKPGQTLGCEIGMNARVLPAQMAHAYDGSLQGH